ncbi:MAG: uroporphyrinogen decarboxylase [Vulcanimicrobiaceae bacterium]
MTALYETSGASTAEVPIWAQARYFTDGDDAAPEHAFLRACRREPTPYTPVWLMRQAGRYLPEYRRVRERLSFLELCRNSEVAAEVTVGTVRKLGVDAAIIFADILLPLIPMGLGLQFEKGEGPNIERPIRCAEDLDRLPHVNPADSLSFVAKTIALTQADLRGEAPVIGFAGAPFTVSSYAVEGGSSRNFVATKTMMYRQPHVWNRLMSYIADLTAAYLEMQIDAGADAVQLFDSWVGALSPEDYLQFVLPYTQQVIASVRSRVPVIYFGTMTGSLLEMMRESGADVIGLDWRVDLNEAWGRLGSGLAVQGNLDPVRLFAGASDIRKAVRDILARAEGQPGHIFNLGHGVLPGTPVDNVLAMIDAVHEYSRK